MGRKVLLLVTREPVLGPTIAQTAPALGPPPAPGASPIGLTGPLALVPKLDRWDKRDSRASS